MVQLMIIADDFTGAIGYQESILQSKGIRTTSNRQSWKMTEAGQIH